MTVSIVCYHEAPASYHEYDPKAPDVARLVGEAIAAAEPRLAVEHVGSTAVPGCAGKGVVDLMLLYPAGLLDAAKAALDRLGFQRQSTRDPFPEDRPMRLGAIEHSGKVYRLHVHVIAAEADEAAVLRSFRDRLRADPILRAAYEVRKREIVQAGITDSVNYSEAKGDFIRGSA